MTQKEVLLLRKLGEEACEVSQRIDKIVWFGMNEIQEEYNQTNQERLLEEINDLFGAMDVLVENNIIPVPLDEDKVQAKKLKIYKWLEYAKSLGMWK